MTGLTRGKWFVALGHWTVAWSRGPLIYKHNGWDKARVFWPPSKRSDWGSR